MKPAISIRKKVSRQKLVSAVLAEIYAGKPKSVVARKHHLSISTVNRWLDEHPMPNLGIDENGRAVVSRHSQRIVYKDTDSRALTQTDAIERIGVKLYGYLEGTIDTLTTINRHARNPHWLQRQTAGELAQFHRELNNSAIRLTDAFSRGAEEESGDAGGDEAAGVSGEQSESGGAGSSGNPQVVDGTFSEGSSAAR